ncbi:unnamed protein product [Adineta steineri]|uniref:Uncharacterized protein n=1 Tax=Adineta steineri TaxID=433720 RepID=A0A814TDP5_9BILA|nr:unnamed protein product [Adineta steineri]CAF3535406.1 unnamed protein product [Adineta steineri]
MDDITKNLICTEKPILLNSSNDSQFVIIDWYLQQHGSFSSGGRSRDISLTEFSSTQQLIDYLINYIEKNYQHVNINDRDYHLIDLCRIAFEESKQFLISNKNEISRVTSRHIWPPNHKLLLGCLINAYIVSTTNKEQENTNKNYCLITQLGNYPTHIKFVRGSYSLREEIFERFKHPFQTNFEPSQKQIDLFIEKSQTLTVQQFCHYIINRQWHDLDNEFSGILVDFIVVGEPFLFN